jgi:hypothetical protein
MTAKQWNELLNAEVGLSDAVMATMVFFDIFVLLSHWPLGLHILALFGLIAGVSYFTLALIIYNMRWDRDKVAQSYKDDLD